MKSKALTFLEALTGGPLHFAQLLESTMKCDGYTQTRFADVLGITVEDLRDILRSRLTVQPSVARAWAAKLGYCADTWGELAWETWGLEAEAQREAAAMDDREPTNPRFVIWGEGK